MKINDDLIGTVKNSTKWNNMEDDSGTTNDVDTWIPVLNQGKLQHTTIDSIVSRGIKSGIKSQIVYVSWQNVILTRSDPTWLYLILYGSNLLKEGNYSIANDFKIVTYGTINNSDLTIPRSAIKEIHRYDWGFELVAKRSEISGNSSGDYNGVAVAHDGDLIIQST